MMTLSSGCRIRALLLLSGFLLPCLQPSESVAAGYGSLAGLVSDDKGVPLMGATVMVIGPMAFATEATNQTVERMITDAHGRFTIAHLIPGCYSLKVSSPTRLPEMRNGVRVQAGETVVATFVLTDTFAPIRFQMPSNSVSSWGDDWKWVLRTSSNTRPILRFREQPQAKQVAAQDQKSTIPPSERFFGFLPGSTPHDPLAEDFGMASVFAYLHPLSVDSDVLVAGSLAPFGADATSIGTVLLRNQLKGEPQQIGLFLHQISLVAGTSVSPGAGPNTFGLAKGMVATYSETRLLAPKVTITAGMDINYLSAIDSVFTAQPHVKLEYQASPQTMVSAQFGSARAEGSNSMMDRLGLLNAFPQITQRDGHLEMEQLNHTEVAVNHRIGKSARVQAAAYHDGLRNAAVWGLGPASGGQAFAGNSLPNPAGNGIVINGGNYQSTGFRAVYAQTFGSHLEVLGAFSSGTALSARGFVLQGSHPYSQGVLTPEQTNSLIGKITADLPGTHTRFSASYEWVPNDRITLVDPAGQANFEVQPYLGVQIRQPIPTPSFLPVHIDAVADFQNLLSQGYVPAGQGGQKPMVLTSGYHYIRGGFSVQF
ncbi:MAG: carboxypeptidase-like regulatory domain-containing protein [Terriglobia bacterium]